MDQIEGSLRSSGSVGFLQDFQQLLFQHKTQLQLTAASGKRGVKGCLVPGAARAVFRKGGDAGGRFFNMGQQVEQQPAPLRIALPVTLLPRMTQYL